MERLDYSFSLLSQTTAAAWHNADRHGVITLMILTRFNSRNEEAV